MGIQNKVYTLKGKESSLIADRVRVKRLDMVAALHLKFFC